MYDNGVKVVKDKFLAVYPFGLKVCKDNNEAFDPQHLCKILNKAKTYKFEDIKSFRFDPDEGDFTFVYKPNDDDTDEIELRFKSARIPELKKVIRESIELLRQQLMEKPKDLLSFE